jgi:hypothetical protein
MLSLHRVPGLLGLVVLAACTNHHSGGPTSLSTPSGSVIGNWVVDGSSIQVVTDTGAAHDVHDGDTFRIGPNGLEVLLGSYMLPGGVYDTFLRRLGASYTVVTNRAVGSELETSLVVDRSAAHGEPSGTLVLSIDVTGVLVGTKLQVTYLGRTLVNNQEQDRDHVRFDLLPGPAVQADMSGTFDLSDIQVIADLGQPHPYQLGVPTTFAGAKVTQLLGMDFSANEVLGTTVGDYVVIESLSNAMNGRAEALFMALGKANTPSAGLRRYIVFDGIRVGDGVLALLFQIDDPTQQEDIDVLDLAMTRRTAGQAVVLRATGNTPGAGRKLATFLTLGL